MKSDELFEIFWDIKDKTIKNPDNTMSLSVVISPKYGKFSTIIWFILEKFIELCKSLIFKKPI